jgi:Xaa-Pro dipeptidase
MTEDRYAALRAALTRADLDAAVLTPGSTFLALHGRSFHSHERPLAVIVPRQGAPVAVVPHLEAASFAGLGFPGEVFHWRDEEGFRGAFDRAARALSGIRRLGVEGQVMRVFERDALASALGNTELVDAQRLIAGLRLRKSADGVAKLRQAIRISEAALEATLVRVRSGQTEKEIEAMLLGELFAHGAEGLAFHPIVAAGSNSAQPHAQARPDYRVQAGDALLFDFGATVAGWCADITRTVFVGHAGEEDRALYETVLAANRAGCAAARPGLAAGALDDIVLRVLEASPFAGFMRHKTGHGLGLDVHEEPYIMRGNAQVLEAGMVFTVEPGLYRLGRIGVRIEDDVVVTDGGCEVLTTVPGELRVVGG